MIEYLQNLTDIDTIRDGLVANGKHPVRLERNTEEIEIDDPKGTQWVRGVAAGDDVEVFAIYPSGERRQLKRCFPAQLPPDDDGSARVLPLKTSQALLPTEIPVVRFCPPYPRPVRFHEVLPGCSCPQCIRTRKYVSPGCDLLSAERPVPHLRARGNPVVCLMTLTGGQEFGVPMKIDQCTDGEAHEVPTDVSERRDAGRFLSALSGKPRWRAPIRYRDAHPSRTCPTCANFTLVRGMKQLRSADEAASVVWSCAFCAQES